MYTLEPNPKGYSVLSLDPGSSNFGIACSADVGGKLVLKANSVLSNPMKNMKGDLRSSRIAFLKEIDYWVSNFNCKAIIAERYQARGIRGNSGELISMMMGIVLQRYRKLDIQFVTAASWKNDWNRNHDIDLKDLYKVCRTTPHQLDATLIGAYFLQQKMKRRYEYSLQSLIDGVAGVSCAKLFNRKAVL